MNSATSATTATTITTTQKTVIEAHLLLQMLSPILGKPGHAFATRSANRDWSEVQAGGRSVAESAAKLVEGHDLRLVALGAQGLLEILDQLLAELGVRLRARDDAVELAADMGELLSRPHPALGRGWKRAQQLRQARFVVGAFRGHHTQDGSADGFLPAKISRSLPRQREMRLAIVPAG